MGCSASRPNTHFTAPSADQDPSFHFPNSSPHFSISSSPHFSKSFNKKKPISRTHSLPSPLVHHPPLKKGDSNHLVSLTSTTYGSLVLINHSTNSSFKGGDEFNESPTSYEKDPVDFSSPDSVINTWELMDGLDEFDDDFSIRGRPFESAKKPSSDKYCGFGGSEKKLLDSYEIVKSSDVIEEEVASVSKPLWKHLSEESLLAKMDHNVVSSYRRALSSRHLGSKNQRGRSMESSPINFSQPKRVGSLGTSPINFSQPKRVGSLGTSPINFSQPKIAGSLRASPTKLPQLKTIELFVSNTMNIPQPKTIESLESSPMNIPQHTTVGSLVSNPINPSQSKIVGPLSCPKTLSQQKTVGSLVPSPLDASQHQNFLPGTENKIVMYITSLRGIRKTYEDCCMVRMILKGFRVMVDERDISMDSAYRKELQSVLGKTAVSLPQLFIRGVHIGGGEEVKQLNEIGEMGKLLEGFPFMDVGFVCKVCGDARFVPCQGCNGSRKVFEEEEGRLRRCFDCNENGLIRCSTCCP